MKRSLAFAAAALALISAFAFLNNTALLVSVAGNVMARAMIAADEHSAPMM